MKLHPMMAIEALRMIWPIIRYKDGRKIAIWINKGRLSTDYALQLLIEHRIQRRVRLPEWLGVVPVPSVNSN